MGRHYFRGIKLLFIFLCTVANVVFAGGDEHKNYIDFQIRGITVAENQQSSNYNNGILWTSTNFEVDFNFNKYFAIETVTSLSNRYNGLTRPHAIREQLNGGREMQMFFDNHGLTSRVLALSFHNDNTEFLIGKIRPDVGIGNDMISGFNNDWSGLYGTMIPSAYTNSNKIGLQLHADVQMFKYSKQMFEISLFKNDTTKMNDAVFADTQTFGHSAPYELRNFLTKRIAGDTTLPASFSILFVNKVDLPSGNNLNYALTFRKQAVDSQYSFAKDENTYLTSAQYEKKIEASTLGVFSEIGTISNAHGVRGLREYYFTASGYFAFEKFTVALVYNTYKLNGHGGFGIPKVTFSQNQVSFGYKFTPAYKVNIAYRSIKDGQSGKSGQGAGIGFSYDFGTRTERDLNGRSRQSII